MKLISNLLAGLAAVLLFSQLSFASPTCNFNISVQRIHNNPYDFTIFLPGYQSSSKTTDSCVLRKNTKSNAVKVLQHAMNRCYQTGTPENGFFGSNTKAALVEVQGRIGAKQTGIYGPRTRNLMHWEAQKYRFGVYQGLVCSTYSGYCTPDTC